MFLRIAYKYSKYVAQYKIFLTDIRILIDFSLITINKGAGVS